MAEAFYKSTSSTPDMTPSTGDQGNKKRKKPGTIFGVNRRNLLAVLGLTSFLILTMAGVYIALFQRTTDRDTVAPTAPDESKADFSQVGCSLTFDVASQPLAGNHTTVTCYSIRGWTCLPDLPDRAILVEIYEGGPRGTGAFVGTVRAREERGDGIAARCGGNGNHGFTFKIPAEYIDGETHQYYVYGVDPITKERTLLNESPRSFDTSVCQEPAPSPTPSVTPEPSPTPSPTPSVSPSPSPTPTPTPSVTPTPTPSVSPSPVPTPTPAPGCNDNCQTNADCSNSNHICYAGVCRLDTHPTSPYCVPPTVASNPPAPQTPVASTAPQQPVLPEELPQTGLLDNTVGLLGLGAAGVIIGGLLLILL